jgi:hypothetical protein
MSIIEAFTAAAKRVVANIIAAVQRLSTQELLVTSDGEIFVKEPVIQTVADKISAVLLASAALFFLLSPIQGKAAMEIGDQLLRAATFLWSGGTDGSRIPSEGLAV